MGGIHLASARQGRRGRMRSFIGPAFVPSRFWQTRTVTIAARTPIATIASILGHSESIAHEPWVTWDEELCIDKTVTIAVQVMGKVRATLEIAKDAPEAEAKAAALALENVAKFIEGKPIKNLSM